ncbi:short-chain dehydrogenase/reductase SDR [Candidatus Koribacter versatilis Ellin345]|uniref:Short-chain dehydrogenase/reductase SDR n=1 Tax=Koribacter versatilis (strain Ellin345) TaxID=204669 RepID=Q1IK61_KORVE|nr:glucose 1-dehydrogenase [Candidatus Koribacter versatilis]ABF42739.1 short-chain dehydrogenase/reductase SDR [Candidatus Koribacter versatilis Ellin345]
MKATKALQDKVALITGGSSGIGLATAKRFVDEGAFVFLTGRREPELLAAANELGPSAIAIRTDSSLISDVEKILARIRETKGKLDILFANAGIGEFLPLGVITEEHFDKIFSTNVKGIVFLVQKALPLMPSGSSIVLNASIASIKGMPAFSIYSASKAALRSFARSWTTDLRRQQIRVNAVSPGVISTPGYDGLGLSKQEMETFLKTNAETIPLGRVGTPDEVAKAVVFLSSDESSYISGIELFVDGGLAQI